MTIDNSQTGIPNELRFLTLMVNQNRLKIDLNQNCKSPSPD